MSKSKEESHRHFECENCYKSLDGEEWLTPVIVDYDDEDGPIRESFAGVI